MRLVCVDKDYDDPAEVHMWPPEHEVCYCAEELKKEAEVEEE